MAQGERVESVDQSRTSEGRGARGIKYKPEEE
jgi:hypothetical protein